MYSLTDDFSYIHNVIKTTEEGRVIEALFSLQTRKFVFGAGWWGENIVRTYSGIHFEGFIDNNPNKKECAGLPVISFLSILKNIKML